MKEEADKFKGKFDMGWDEYRVLVSSTHQSLPIY
jgi:hypothetical protein